MNEPKHLPDLERVKKTVANSRRRRQELELASLQIEDLILKLEAENIQQRRKHLEKTLNNP